MFQGEMTSRRRNVLQTDRAGAARTAPTRRSARGPSSLPRSRRRCSRRRLGRMLNVIVRAVTERLPPSDIASIAVTRSTNRRPEHLRKTETAPALSAEAVSQVPPEGFEPPTYGTGNRRSIP